eukprot:403352143
MSLILNLSKCHFTQPALSLKTTHRNKITQILDFWFSKDYDRHTIIPAQLLRKWFNSTEQFDQEAKQLFANDLENLKNGEYNDWINDHQGRLASIILGDQLSRNIHRRKKQAFDYDHIALKTSKHILQNNQLFQPYKNFEKVFILMPLEHSENLDDQYSCYYALQNISHDIEKQGGMHDAEVAINMMIKYSYQHLQVIEQFGRFPYRNDVLGRKNTEEEIQYLKDAQRYGQ